VVLRGLAMEIIVNKGYINSSKLGQYPILTLLGEKGAIIGIVGDPAQSIFSFNGAERNKLIEFELEEQVNYEMKTNRRSTQNIISLLNHIRQDDTINLSQDPLDPNNIGNRIKLLVYSDDLEKGVENYLSTVGKGSYCILARKNILVNKIKGLNENTLQQLIIRDSSRAGFFEHIFNSIEFTTEGYYGNAVNELLHILKTDSEGNLKKPFTKGVLKNRIEKQIVASNILFFIINYIKQKEDSNVFQFYLDAKSFLFNTFSIELSNYRARGELYEFNTTITLSSVIKSQNSENKQETVRTIHKSKGSEFNSVLVVFEKESELERFVINPQARICSIEDDCRIFYVALSRAKEELVIAIPSLNDNKRSVLSALGIDIDNELSVNYTPPQTLSSFFG
jgi:DNA helicase-2/ATP-dependent DNA helicase PcrA